MKQPWRSKPALARAKGMIDSLARERGLRMPPKKENPITNIGTAKKILTSKIFRKMSVEGKLRYYTKLMSRAVDYPEVMAFIDDARKEYIEQMKKIGEEF
ncbi:MAG TPA: hypothetical protein VFF13_01090 [archaeon]|nr:hypothetical protein [archaeon]